MCVVAAFKVAAFTIRPEPQELREISRHANSSKDPMQGQLDECTDLLGIGDPHDGNILYSHTAPRLPAQGGLNR